MNSTSNQCNETNHNNVDLVAFSVIGNSSKCFISFFGLLTNCLTLKIFHRRKWLKQKQMLFFVVGTISNLLACVTIFIPSTIFLFLLHFHSTLIMSQVTCLGYVTPSDVTNTISMRFGLLIAMDRLTAQWFSFDWFRSRIRIKWILIILIYFLTIFQVSFWFYFATWDVKLWCFWNDISYPKQSLWHPVTEFINMFFTILTLIFFLLVPLSTIYHGKSLIRQINAECFIIHEQNIFLKKRETLARVRLLSFIYVAGLLCTLCAGSILGEIAVSHYFCDKPKTALLLSTISDLLMNVHFTFTPFIFLLDASFRHELKRYLRPRIC